MTRDSSRPGLITLASIGLLTLACASTPESRIDENRSLFDSYPAEVKANIRQGRVDLGYDEGMVRMALGNPDEVFTDTDEYGDTLMWGYVRSTPGISVGLGGGSYVGRGGSLGGGVGLGTGPRRDYTAIIEFREGKVTRVREFGE